MQHIVPFLFTVKNQHAQADFMGYLRYTKSHRKKDVVEAHINFGCYMIRVGDLNAGEVFPKDESRNLDYYGVFASYLRMYGYDEEYFGADGALDEMSEVKFRKFLEANGATLRFW